MKKMEVTSLISSSLVMCVFLVNSSIGKNKPKSHPLSSIKSYFNYSDLEGIKVKDIIRCDGLPFMSRPAPILKYYDKLNKKYVPNHSYKPFKLPSGYWVLRPILEVSENE